MFSTRQVAKKLGITHPTLLRYVSTGKVPAPTAVSSGGMTIHLWTDEDVERVRQLLPKIANGRKKHSALSSQQSVKPKAKTKAKPKK